MWSGIRDGLSFYPRARAVPRTRPRVHSRRSARRDDRRDTGRGGRRGVGCRPRVQAAAGPKRAARHKLAQRVRRRRQAPAVPIHPNRGARLSRVALRRPEPHLCRPHAFPRGHRRATPAVSGGHTQRRVSSSPSATPSLLPARTSALSRQGPSPTATTTLSTARRYTRPPPTTRHTSGWPRAQTQTSPSIAAFR